MAARRPVVVLLCSTSGSLRNVVESGMLDRLEQYGVRGHLVQPGVDGMGSEPLLPREARGLPALRALLRASFARRHRIASYPIFNRWRRRHARLPLRARYSLLESLSVVGCRRPFYDWQVRVYWASTQRLYHLDPVRARLAALRPALVVSTNCQFASEEPFLFAARALGIPTLACIQSFDNLSSRSVLPVFEHYAVWNERMRDQLLAYYPDRDPGSVQVTGCPQFDFHRDARYRRTREDVLAELGLGPAGRYVLYAANHHTYTPTEPDLVAAFAARAAGTPALRDHHVVVRPHPLDELRRWEPLAAGGGRISVSWPGAGPRVDQSRLVSTLLHADACVTMASTMALDAAAVGTPVVCTAFALARGTSEDRFCREAHRTEHYRPIAESGGVRVASDLDGLVAEIAAYARDRGRDAAARDRIAAAECGTLDGHAAERVAAAIANAAGVAGDGR